MDWLRQVPMGQYVDGSTGWLRRLDPRLKLAWSLVFLLTPVLAGPLWRVGLVVALVLMLFMMVLSSSLIYLFESEQYEEVGDFVVYRLRRVLLGKTCRSRSTITPSGATAILKTRT